ncbi:hypothetical protein Lal_00034002 [Lupinus albus]|nr:hypothetical protein Lal_00034002 [Lupinus albus]
MVSPIFEKRSNIPKKSSKEMKRGVTQPAPTNEPEPTTAPNQPESHAQSSASAAMPTNQMIMEELVSI